MPVATPQNTQHPLITHQRSLAPDVARGFMLLFIALAHAHLFVWGQEFGFRGYPNEMGLIDQVVAGLQLLFVDGRAMPMFAALFGYGLVQLTTKQLNSGMEWPRVRKLLRRRSLWLVVFGFFHALLLFAGDIMGTYGLIGLIFAGFIVRKDKALLWLAAITGVVHIAIGWILGLAIFAVDNEGAISENAMLSETFRSGAIERVLMWSIGTPLFLMAMVLTAFALGVLAARSRLLDEPEQNRPLLRKITVAGFAISLIGGAPLMLTQVGVWENSDAVGGALFTLHSITGIAGGLAAAALVGLVASHVRGEPGPITRALSAVGQRSMTCYLLQSVAWTALFYPYGLGLGEHLTHAQASGVGVLVWLTTVLIASLMARANKRGPAEVLLRQLTYGRQR
ncbi:DUF418 domain-containing protein [Natronoglycomyces albus]|uniref:DUF418 domain-containing protein n=1 Tax=Natronoglycomyces albus TaxID=2811108 RepID=A0A895XHN7_9ACTN|nr:DUF418 domain-containing protein [Natronoglycomyces albus]QSB04447.1 DUF418 domain-containing protein [Natronoglycomyces albus]